MKTYTILPQVPERQLHLSVLLGITLLFQLAIYDSLSGVTGAGADDGSIFRQMMWGLLGLMNIGYVIGSKIYYPERRFCFGGWPIALMLLYMFASTAWSSTPDATFKRSVTVTFMIMACGITLANRGKDWRNDAFSDVFTLPMVGLMGMSIFLTFASPARSFTEIGWRGVTTHKNLAGQMVAVTMLMLLYGVFHKKLGMRLRLVLLAISTALLVMSKGTTELLALVFGIGVTEVIMLFPTLRRMGSWRLPFLSMLFLGAVFVFFAFLLEMLPTVDKVYSMLLSGLGKSETFTGRTAIWSLVNKELGFHNPWFGGGYGGFWNGRGSISGFVIIGTNLYPGQAHNGYLDVFNDLGILGLCLLGLFVAVALYRAGRLALMGHPEAKLHYSIPLMCVFLNLGESTFFRNTHFGNIVFLASFIRAAWILKQADQAKQASAQPVAAQPPAAQLSCQ